MPDPKSEIELLAGTTLLAVFAWLLGILLLANSFLMYRFLEGYYGPFKWIKRYKKRQTTEFDDLKKQVEHIFEKVESGQRLSPEEREKLFNKRLRLARHFPATRDLLLPTSFGNTLRAFETYTTTMFGFEAIDGWFRIQSVLSEDFRKLVAEAKSIADFYVSLWFVSLALIIEVIALFFISKDFSVLAFLFSLLLVLGFASLMYGVYLGALKAGVEWGNFVKASIETHLPDLHKKLAFPAATGDALVEMWTNYSMAITFRDPDRFPERSHGSEEKQVAKTLIDMQS